VSKPSKLSSTLAATREAIHKIIKLVLEAAEVARAVGIKNILQPGLVKELIIADILGHQPITSKRDSDACDPNDPTILYEYLSCVEKGSGQFDRMFKEPLVKREESLLRISRNSKIYFAVFYKDNQTKVKVIYELEVKPVLDETIRQLDRSRNAISHVGFGEPWVKQNGKVVYRDPDIPSSGPP
jgi:hypothetical protein